MAQDAGPATVHLCVGIENLRPETEAAVEAFMIIQATPMSDSYAR